MKHNLAKNLSSTIKRRDSPEAVKNIKSPESILLAPVEVERVTATYSFYYHRLSMISYNYVLYGIFATERNVIATANTVGCKDTDD